MSDHPIPDDALQEHVAIVGKTGTGKTYVAKGLVERLLAGARHVVVVDPTGVWWGLKSSADGRRPGFPVVVFGGDRADVPLREEQGGTLGELVVGERIQAIVDVSGFLMGERRRFLAEFLAALYHRARAPIHLVLDEADEMAPQRPLPESRVLLHRVDQIVRRGRSRGFRVVMVTQRPAVLHKDVLSQAATLVAMKLTAPQDRAALGAWIEGQADRDKGREILAGLPRLKTGQGWVWWPEGELLRQVAFPPIATFDSSSAPAYGDRMSMPVLAAVDIAALREKLAPPAEPHAPTSARASDRAALEGARAEGYADGHRDGLVSGADNALDAMREALDQIGRRRFIFAASKEAAKMNLPAEVTHPESTGRNRPSASRPTRAAAGDAAPLHAAAERMLAVLVRHYPAALTWHQVATLAGLKAGGHFNAGRADLRQRGLIVQDGTAVRASDLGIAADPGDWKAPESATERLEMWCGKLASPAPDMLRALARHGDLTPAELAAAIGKQGHGGHWNGGMATLRRHRLIEVNNGRIELSDMLREKGR
ncbi:MAG TPA: helicase HerA-like domain-containing protein [Acetobacteraceae bacterium]|nr:helicase HerA-like domain-containing protein [Acetobacteraceae bacterium]